MLDFRSMESSIEFDSCTKLAQIAFDSFNARRENEWKVGLAIWGLIILTAKYVLSDPKAGKIHALVAICAGMLAILHAAFVYGVWTKNDFDESVFRYFSARAADMVLGRVKSLAMPPLEPTLFPDLCQIGAFVKDGSSIFQIAITSILCIVCGLIVCSPISG